MASKPKHVWKYFRDKKAKVSKWTLGNNWVTKWDIDKFCIIGINGTRSDLKTDSVETAKEYIEKQL